MDEKEKQKDDLPLEADLTKWLTRCESKAEARKVIARHCEYIGKEVGDLVLDTEQTAILGKLK